MLKINKKVEYALIALRHMSEKFPGELTTAKEICDLYKTPFDVCSRVLQILAQHQVLKSEHGAHGGYLIQKDLSKISLLKLIEILQGPVKLVNCLSDTCDLLSNCNIVSPIARLNDKVTSFYDTITVRELVLSDAKKSRTTPPAGEITV